MDLNKLRHPSGFLKLIEIGLLVLIMALYFSQRPIGGWTNFTSSVIIGSFINTIVFLVVMLMGYDEVQKTPLELLLYSYYLLATLVTGILFFTTQNGPCIAGGVFCLMLVALYCLEWYLAFMNLTQRAPSFLPEVFPPAGPPHPVHQQQQQQQQQPHDSRQNFSTEAYPPPPTYPNNPPMQNVDLGNPFDERHLQQL